MLPVNAPSGHHQAVSNQLSVSCSSWFMADYRPSVLFDNRFGDQVFGNPINFTALLAVCLIPPNEQSRYVVLGRITEQLHR